MSATALRTPQRGAFGDDDHGSAHTPPPNRVLRAGRRHFGAEPAAATARPTLRRIEFAGSDEDEAAEFLREAYGTPIHVGGLHGDHWRVAVSGIDVGEFKSTTVTLPSELAGVAEGRDEFIVSTTLSGSTELADGKTVERYGVGDTYLAVFPESVRRFTTENFQVHAISLPASLLDTVARSASPSPSSPWRLLAHSPAAGGARQWRTVTRFVDDLLTDPEMAGSPLIVGQAARLLAATMLTIFPNTAVGEPAGRDAHDGHPDTLRRAVAFIDANPDLDMAIADIARAANVTSRAVQLAFRRHLDTTPTIYLRQVRLQHAHQQLLDAEHGDGTTVTRVAIDWGFANPSRFAHHYRATYGLPPSETLRN